jgi:RNA polymerase sigma-70 factor (ECF subfamily)
MPPLLDALPLSSEALAPFAPLLDVLLGEGGALDRALRESILLAAAAAAGPATMPPLAPAGERAEALRAFGRKLAGAPVAVGAEDVEVLRRTGLGDEEILETTLAAACGRALGVLARARAPRPPAAPPAPAAIARPGEARRAPHLRSVERTPNDFPPFARLKERYGFVPRLFRAQTLAPEALDAQVRILERLLFEETALRRDQKQIIALAVSAANRDTYGATLHGKTLQMAGAAAEEVERIAADPGAADLPAAEQALLEAARRAGVAPGELDPPDFPALRRCGWSDAQVDEAMAVAALAALLAALQAGLGVPPDFRPRRDFAADPPAGLKLSGAPARPTGDEGRPPARPEDPDGATVAAAKAGDMSAFEALVRKHQGRVYRTLRGITGNADDAQDGAQAVFLKVFRKLGDFEGQSLFTTWLHRIAVNEGLERLRARRPQESLDETSEDDFQPRSFDAWVEDPETRCARDQTRRLVEDAVGRLPAPYRAALLLRDIQQLSGAEAAAALGIPLATLKTRLLRGRLLLREALAGLFAAGAPPREA